MIYLVLTHIQRWPLTCTVNALDERGKNMMTILIVLLVLFVLGGGGWGYSRWRG